MFSVKIIIYIFLYFIFKLLIYVLPVYNNWIILKYALPHYDFTCVHLRSLNVKSQSNESPRLKIYDDVDTKENTFFINHKHFTNILCS